MKKRLILICSALAIALAGCTAAVAAAFQSGEGAAPAPAGEPDGEAGYVLTEYEGAIGVYRGDELILTSPVDLDGLRSADRELIKNGIETGSYDDVLRLLEDFGS